VKLLFRVLIGLFLFSASVSAQPPFTAGALTNPAINTILADTGPLLLGSTQPAFVVCSTVASVVVLEYRDATNTINLYSQVFAVPISSCFQYFYPLSWAVAPDERIRLRLNSAIVGSIQASLNSI
jgi:hypothetical protein